MIKFIGQRTKTYLYLMDDYIEEKKEQVTKKCVTDV